MSTMPARQTDTQDRRTDGWVERRREGEIEGWGRRGKRENLKVKRIDCREQIPPDGAGIGVAFAEEAVVGVQRDYGRDPTACRGSREAGRSTRGGGMLQQQCRPADLRSGARRYAATAARWDTQAFASAGTPGGGSARGSLHPTSPSSSRCSLNELIAASLQELVSSQDCYLHWATSV